MDPSAAPHRRQLPDSFRPGDRLYGLDAARREIQAVLEAHLSDPAAQSDVTLERINARLGISTPPGGSWRLPEPAQTRHATDRAFVEYLRAHAKQSAKPADGEDANARIRRATKRSIDFTVERGGTVHFILDGIALEAVAQKRNHGHEGWKDVTGSELRYLYRNRERFAGRVLFYREGSEVPAPWEGEDGATWDVYEPGTKQAHTWGAKSAG